MFFITHEETGNSTAIVEIDGPLNSETSSDFENYTSKLSDNGIIYILINSAKINFISSEGIGAVLLLHRKVASINGVVVFFSVSREISLLFHLLGFDSLIETAPDRDAAVEYARQRGAGSGVSITPASREARKSFREEPEDKKSSGIPAVNTAAGDDHAAIRSFVIECVKCSSPVRVSMKGEHYCPYCSAPFTVSGEGNAIFRMRDIPSTGG